MFRPDAIFYEENVKEYELGKRLLNIYEAEKVPMTIRFSGFCAYFRIVNAYSASSQLCQTFWTSSFCGQARSGKNSRNPYKSNRNAIFSTQKF